MKRRRELEGGEGREEGEGEEKKYKSEEKDEVKDFLHRLETGQPPYFERKTTIPPMMKKIYQESLPLPPEVLNLIYQKASRGTGTLYDHCIDLTSRGKEKKCVAMLENYIQSSTNKYLFSKFLCEIYCLLKNLPTFSLVKPASWRTKDVFGETLRWRRIPFRIPFNIVIDFVNIENPTILAKIVYNVEKRIYQTTLSVALEGKVVQNFRITIEDLIEIISHFGSLTPIKFTTLTNPEEPFLSYVDENIDRNEMWHTVGPEFFIVPD